MHCAHCSEKIFGKPLRQSGDYFCSLECARLASGIDPEEDESYFEESALDELIEDED